MRRHEALVGHLCLGWAKSELLRAGHDVVWAGHWATDPGDLQILELARREQRTLVTLDKDFGELAVLRGLPHCGIVRLVGLRAWEQAPMLMAALELHGLNCPRGRWSRWNQGGCVSGRHRSEVIEMLVESVMARSEATWRSIAC